jgi:hypothetical protein
VLDPWFENKVATQSGLYILLTMRKEVIRISTGTKYGFLTIGDLVHDVVSHPLYLTTPPSYVHQGALRECQCDCGMIVLYSENALVSGRLKSCGCLRRKRNAKAMQESLDRDQVRANKKEITFRIAQLQHRLRTIQSTPASLRNPQVNQEERNIADKLRRFYALKGYANRKDVPNETLAKKVRELANEC